MYSCHDSQSSITLLYFKTKSYTINKGYLSVIKQIFICSKLLTRKVGKNTYKQFTTDKVVYCHFHRKQTYLSWYSLTIIFFIAKETNIPKLVLIDNCFPDLIETSTFMLYDVQQMLSIGKLKSISMTDTIYFMLH